MLGMGQQPKNGDFAVSTNVLQETIQELARQRFYGSLEVKLEAGRVVLLRKTETIKPDDHRDNRGERNEYR